MKKLILLSLFITSLANAAGGGGHGSPADLVWPAINFVALFGFLIFKLRKPLSEMFDRQAKDVQETYEMAEKKDKEAQIKLETFQKKMSSFDRERQKAIEESNKEAELLAASIKRETQSTIEKLKVDAKSKVEHEREQLNKQLNAGLVDEVIARARQKISNSKDYQSKVTEKLVNQVGR